MGLKEAFVQIVGREAVKTEEPMAYHTTFRIGGPADYYIMPSEAEQVRDVVAICRQRAIPFYVIGNGSNLLVDDAGYRGVIIALDRHFSRYQIEEECVISCQSGILLSKLANAALKQQWSGMEFASGIPGTLGGAVTMNAGAYGGEMADIIKSAVVMDLEGNRITLSKEELELGYRTSTVMRKGYIVLEAKVQLKPGKGEEIAAVMQELNTRRKEKQPLEYPSAGSTFKRPVGYFAGKLIEDAGLKGYRVGDAMVSEKHSGFVINAGNATAAEVKQLIADVQERVLAHSGVKLEPEVKFLN